MKNGLLFLFIVLGLNLSSHAESAAKKDRGASCTDLCTSGSKHAITNPTTKSQHDRLCLETNKEIPGNVHWCQAKCLDEGSLWSKLKNRKKDVEKFIEASKKRCAS